MKIPAEFAPQSWEMPPGFRVLEESASVVTREFDGETLDWLVALFKIPANELHNVWIRPLDARFDTGFIAFEPPFYHPSSVNPKIRHLASRSALSNIWKNKHFGRRLCLNEEGMLRSDGEALGKSVLFARDGKGVWEPSSSDDTASQRIGLFKWSEPLTEAEFYGLSSYKLWKRLRESPSESISDACFARKFVSLEQQERQELVFGKSALPMSEFETLLRVVALQEGLDEIPVGATLLVDSSKRFGNHFYWDDGGSDELSIGSKEFQRDVALLRAHFFPIVEELVKHLCVHEWVELYGPASHIRIPYPTAHEQLEAALRWREWKANHEKL